MKKLFALIGISAFLLVGCADNNTIGIIDVETPEITEAEISIAEAEIDEELDTARKVLDNFIASVQFRSVDGLLQYSDVDMFYYQSVGKLDDSDTMSERLKKSLEEDDSFYDMFLIENTEILAAERSDIDIPEFNRLMESGEFAENIEEYYNIDGVYKFTLPSGYIYVLHVNGEWKTEVALTPYMKTNA